MKKLSLNAIKQHDRKRNGYYEDLISKGTIEGDFLLLEDAVYAELKNKYNTQKSFPNVMQQMKNVAVATNAVFNNVLNNQPVLASDEIKRQRLDICFSCPELENGRCKKCGCNYKAKISLASSGCPKGLW